MSGIFSMRGASESANFKTKICLILVIFILSRRSSLYITNPRTFIILKDFNLVKSSLSLSLIILINIIFILGILYRKYTLFFFLRVSPQTLFLLVNFLITLLKNTRFYHSFFYNSWIFSTIIIKYNTNSSHSLISNKILALNPLFMKNGVLLVILYLEVLYTIISMGNSLIQLVCW